MRLAVLALLAVALLLPAGAVAQSSPFAPLPSAQPDQPPPTSTGSSSSANGDGISSAQESLLIAAGIIFVLGIGFLIARDARKNAPVDARDARPFAQDAGDAIGERKQRDARTAQKQKAAAKRARQARKKNRPVRK